MDQNAASADLDYIRRVLDRTERRVDPHAFHFVHWGAIVLVWYPVMNYLGANGSREYMLPVSLAAFLLGMVLSAVREMRLGKRPRLPGENTFVANQVMYVTWGVLGAAILLSALGPSTGMIDGRNVQIIWGFAYAVMAYMVGVVYRREFMWAGVAIFAGTVVALALPDVAGYLLGPFMGLGMIVPGMMAERRVRDLREETEAVAA